MMAASRGPILAGTEIFLSSEDPVRIRGPPNLLSKEYKGHFRQG
jgi:hypothetical protein